MALKQNRNELNNNKLNNKTKLNYFLLVWYGMDCVFSKICISFAR